MVTDLMFQVLSSVIAAWSDISRTLGTIGGQWAALDTGSGSVPLPSTTSSVSARGYFWMFINCVAAAAYVGCTSDPCLS